MTEPKVEIKNVTVKYSETVAVNNVSVKIKDGEFFTLLGPSGCGKTTLVHAIAGLQKIDKGEIWMKGKLVTSAEEGIIVEPRERNIGMLFQEFSTYPDLLLRDSISVPLKARNEGLSKKEQQERVKRAARLAGVESLLDRKPEQLSGGEKRRAGLARALVRNPSIYLLDEPLSGCDARRKEKLRGDIRNLQKKIGATFISVTHDQTQALSTSDRLMVMEKGGVKQIGTPDELYHHPKHLFVARFVGSPSMNIFDFKLKQTGRKFKLTRNKFEIPISLESGRKLQDYIDKSIIVGIRPGDIFLNPSDERESQIDINAKIEFIERIEPEKIFHLRVGGEEFTMVTEKSASEGSEVQIGMNLEKIHLFDKENGKLIAQGQELVFI